ncbi:MAG: HAMP domain-containing protein, partial [Candidatus Aminicenantes bacterium]|nr:HAMP domain-containing protein [Candidatus Aminicenantes bacterium]
WIAREASRLEGLARILVQDIRPLLAEERRADLVSRVRRAGDDGEVRITVVDIKGTVLADSAAEARTMETHHYRPEIFAALSGQTGSARRPSPTLGRDMLYIALPVREGDGIVGAVRVSLYLQDIDELLASIRSRILRISALAVLLLLGAAFLFARHIGRPVRDLTAASRNVAAGDFQAKVFVRNKDELRTLAESFNAMTLKLKTLFEEGEAQRDEMSQIIGSIREGLLVIGPDDRILMANRSCGTLCRIEDAVGKHYWEVIRHPGFQEAAARVEETKAPAVEEIDVDDRSLLASIVWVPARERRIVTLFDVTEVRRLERIKREFVANISHELRTPLTAVKGFAEALTPGPKEADRRALEAIRRNTDRLIAIVQDLLVLSSLEERGTALDIRPVGLGPLLRDVLDGFEARAAEKGIALGLQAEKGLPDLPADAFRLEQLFQNLVENALKFTEKGRIDVVVRRERDALAVEVRDTGIGIPEEHRPRIFDRFYVVNTSRDKRLGGTGLGLSIAKHIVLRHRGTIDVESRPGRGTVFTVRLPLAA